MDSCYICCDESKENNLIKSFCNCKNTYIHIECLIITIKNTKKTYCTICKKSFNAYCDLRNRIIFPFSNIYYEPLLTNIIFRLSENDYYNNLKYSIINRISDRVVDILNNLSLLDYIEFKKKIKHINNNDDFPHSIIYLNDNNNIQIFTNGFNSYFNDDGIQYKNYVEKLFSDKDKQLLL